MFGFPLFASPSAYFAEFDDVNLINFGSGKGCSLTGKNSFNFKKKFRRPLSSRAGGGVQGLNGTAIKK